MGISVRNLTKSFAGKVVVDDVTFEVGHGELVALLGPSGSGKSTVLRMVAGLEEPDSGRIILTGTDATDIPVRNRGVGFVFQHYALFKHMTVADNIGFGLRVRGEPTPRIRARVSELLSLVQLDGMEKRYPHELSGGQRQRVALARSLAAEPKVLLLDEPFAALDAQVRVELRNWIRRLHEKSGVTSLFVTHDREEAMELADKIVVLHKGRVEQAGPPAELYERPASAFVARFLGPVNVLSGRRVNGKLVVGDSQADLGEHPEVKAFVRPHHLELMRANPSESPALKAEVRRTLLLGSVAKVELQAEDGTVLEVQLTPERFRELHPKTGETLYAGVRFETSLPGEDYSI